MIHNVQLEHMVHIFHIVHHLFFLYIKYHILILLLDLHIHIYILNHYNDLANKAGLQVNKFNGQQRVDIIVKANESLYDNAQFVSYSPNNNDSNAVAGYGFHNAGLNGCAIYLDTDDCLKKIDHEGNVEKLILENELLNLLKDKANSNHYHNIIQDIGDNRDTTFAYSKEDFESAEYMAVWNNSELRGLHKNKIASLIGAATQSDLSNKANLQGGNSFIGRQSSKNNALVSEWSNAPFLSEADASSTDARAMYGFHNAGVTAGVLYLDNDGQLKWRNNNGDNRIVIFDDKLGNVNSKYFTEGNILSNRISSENVKIKTMFILTANYRPDDSPIGDAEGFVIYIADGVDSPRQKAIVLSYSGEAIFQRDIWNGGWLTEWKEIISSVTFDSLRTRVNDLENKFNNLFSQDGNNLTINY